MTGTLMDKSTGEAAKDAELWTAPMRRGMISPFAVGTVDQAMMAAMRTKYGVLGAQATFSPSSVHPATT